MSKYILVIFLFLNTIPKIFSQSELSNYSFVVVPERFDFLNEDDKYQLNSIAEFLFNKHGFHAFRSSATPDAKRCDGLYAEVINLTAMLRTKFVLILRDCNGFEVYRSPEGISRHKEFKKAYQDALRKAFAYFEDMNVKQKEIVYFDEESVSETKSDEMLVSKETAKITRELTEVVKPSGSETISNSNLPQSKFSSYTKDGASYMLRKTSEGYTLFKETESTETGFLLIGKIGMSVDTAKLYFVDASDAIFSANFDTSENLKVQKDGSTVIYYRAH
jgi:hypothetical protein